MGTRRFVVALATATAGAMIMAIVSAAPASAGPPDNDPPTVNVNAAVQAVVGQTLSTRSPATTKVLAAWQQYDDSGICSESGFLQDYSVSGRPVIASFNGVQTSLLFTATEDHYYVLSITATDCSANQNSATTTEYLSAPTVYQEGSATYSPGWTTSNCACFSGGSNEHNAKVGATASFKYRGYGVGFVTEKAPNRGTASIYLDGVLKMTLNNRTSNVSSIIGFSTYSNSYATHTLKIVVKSGRIDVDAFLVSGG